MDRTQEERQLQRVQEKLARMAESDPNLLCLEPPAEEELSGEGRLHGLVLAERI